MAIDINFLSPTGTGISNLTFGQASAGTPLNSSFIHASGTTPYAEGDLVANHLTAGSIGVPNFAANSANRAWMIQSAVLRSNHTGTPSTVLFGVFVEVRLFTAAPTYAGGDNAAYNLATGYDSYIGTLTGFFEQYTNGAVAELFGSKDNYGLNASGTCWWDIRTVAAFTPQSGKTFTFVPAVLQY